MWKDAYGILTSEKQLAECGVAGGKEGGREGGRERE